MDHCGKLLCAALAVASLIDTASAEPPRAIPGTLMAVGVTNPAELESLLNHLESLR
jgi:hypothetical protein